MSRKPFFSFLSGVLTSFLIVLVFALSAPAQERTSSKPSSTSDTVCYELRTIESTYGGCQPGDDSCTYISIQYPLIIKAPTVASRDSINSFVLKYLLSSYNEEQESLDQVLSLFIEDYNNLKRNMPEYLHGWYYHVTVTIVYSTSEILSLDLSRDSYTGGAHGSHHTEYANFNLKTGQRIKLEHILVDDYQQSLNAIAESNFRQIHDIEPEESLEDAGFWFEDNNFRLTDNFSINESGLTFFYNEYEIAPYYKGPTVLTLTYEELTDLIRKDGLIGRG
jgi:hypothetical protein